MQLLTRSAPTHASSPSWQLQIPHRCQVCQQATHPLPPPHLQQHQHMPRASYRGFRAPGRAPRVPTAAWQIYQPRAMSQTALAGHHLSKRMTVMPGAGPSSAGPSPTDLRAPPVRGQMAGAWCNTRTPSAMTHRLQSRSAKQRWLCNASASPIAHSSIISLCMLASWQKHNHSMGQRCEGSAASGTVLNEHATMAQRLSNSPTKIGVKSICPHADGPGVQAMNPHNCHQGLFALGQ